MTTTITTKVTAITHSTLAQAVMLLRCICGQTNSSLCTETDYSHRISVFFITSEERLGQYRKLGKGSVPLHQWFPKGNVPPPGGRWHYRGGP
jgi:hypothetical protein